jgi:hypothetical protein
MANDQLASSSHTDAKLWHSVNFNRSRESGSIAEDVDYACNSGAAVSGLPTNELEIVMSITKRLRGFAVHRAERKEKRRGHRNGFA